MDGVNGTAFPAQPQLGEPPQPAGMSAANLSPAEEAAFAEAIMPMVIIQAMEIMGDIIGSLQKEVEEVKEDLRGE